MRHQFFTALALVIGVTAPTLVPATVRAESLNVSPSGANASSSKRHDRWQQQRARRQQSNTTAKPNDATDYLYAFVDDMLGKGGTHPTVRRPSVRHVTAKPIARPAPVKLAEPVNTPQPANPVTTASIPHAVPLSATSTSPMPTVPALSVAAEKAQAGFDLVKLELARRTYSETQLPGEAVFTTHPDWRMLARSQDTFEPAERAAADAAGFVANAYVNDSTRTIVVAIAGSQDLRRHLITSDIWQALIKAEAPQQFYMAKSYVRSVMQRYQATGYTTECVGHSLGGGACAYVASELNLRAIVVNPIAAGKLAPQARSFVTNYVVDGDVAQRVYAARGNEFAGDLLVISDGQDERRQRIVESYGPLSGPILLIRSVPDSVRAHRIGFALDQIAQFAETARPR